MLLYVTHCTMWRLYFAFVNCLQHLKILSEIWVMPRKLQFAVIIQKLEQNGFTTDELAQKM